MSATDRETDTDFDTRTATLVRTWHALQPECDHRPEAWRALRSDVGRTLGETMARLIELQSQSDVPAAHETDRLLDSTYVLERLDWCVLHRVPFGARPRPSQRQ